MQKEDHLDELTIFHHNFHTGLPSSSPLNPEQHDGWSPGVAVLHGHWKHHHHHHHQPLHQTSGSMMGNELDVVFSLTYQEIQQRKSGAKYWRTFENGYYHISILKWTNDTAVNWNISWLISIINERSLTPTKVSLPVKTGAFSPPHPHPPLLKHIPSNVMVATLATAQKWDPV